MRKRIVFAFVVIVVLHAHAALGQEGLRAGVHAPDFSLPTVKEELVSLGDAVSHGTVILHFWKSK
jgi:hypothetical protein